MMNTSQARLGINPILTALFLGLGQGNLSAKELFPELPMALRGMTVPRMGTERLRKYDLARAPGADTRRVDIHWDGMTYSVVQKAVDIPIPRENIDEASNASKVFGVQANLDMSKTALMTAQAILELDYELDAAAIATLPTTYAAGNVLALAGATKWSAATGTPLNDLDTASGVVRQKTGRNPNTLHLSAVAFQALKRNPQVLNSMSVTAAKILTPELLATLLGIKKVVVGDAVWENGTGVVADVWGNNAILAYVPEIGANGMDLGQPGFGTTNTLKDHPKVETPWYDWEAKTWVYGVTYERAPQIAYNGAGFLFQTPF
jgi:Phage major capsid protein E